MRTISAKSLCVLVGFLVPCFGMTSHTEAGVIPWLYDSIFGYGWGGSGYGAGYGGGMPYSAGYGGWGYGGSGYGASYAPGYSYGYSGYSSPSYAMPTSGAGCCGSASYVAPSQGAGCCGTPTYSTPLSPIPVNSNPALTTPGSPPAEEQLKLNYGPSLGYFDSGYGYSYSSGYTPIYSGDSGNCCNPCATSVGTPVESGPVPTPVENNSKVNQKRPGTIDQFGPTNSGNGSTSGRVRPNNPANEESLPAIENGPARRGPGGATTPMEPPVGEEGVPAGGTQEHGRVSPPDHNIAVRYVPSPTRTRIAVPTSTARVVRIGRPVREQIARTAPKSQLASNP